MLSSIDKYLMSKNVVFFVLLMVVIGVVSTILLSIIFNIFNLSTSDSGIEGKIIILEYIDFGLIRPLIETIIFQWGLITILKKFIIKVNDSFVILVAALVFALSHFVLITDLIMAIPGGLILAYTYVRYLDKTENAFGVTFLIHALFNIAIVSFALFL